MEKIKLEDWILNNFRGWLGEIERNQPYEMKLLEIPFSELAEKYQLTLTKVISSGSADLQQINELCDLSSVVCARVGHGQYSPCQVEDFLMSVLEENASI